jgi:hypothetical protein
MGCGSDNNNNSKTFTVPLTTSGETPPCTAAASGASGNATVTIASDNSSVKVDATFSGLSSAPIAGHIHSGTSAAAGPVVLPFTPNNTGTTPPTFTSPFSQTLTAADYKVVTGAPADFPTFVTALRNGGGGYVNFHTPACPGGEIRGEVQ